MLLQGLRFSHLCSDSYCHRQRQKKQKKATAKTFPATSTENSTDKAKSVQKKGWQQFSPMNKNVSEKHRHGSFVHGQKRRAIAVPLLRHGGDVPRQSLQHLDERVHVRLREPFGVQVQPPKRPPADGDLFRREREKSTLHSRPVSLSYDNIPDDDIRRWMVADGELYHNMASDDGIKGLYQTMLSDNEIIQ